ncbi:hypothetical protein [Streptomyces sp. NBC_01465]|uniref:hypothetical protein n=1 Tax=Streptomyces sp. NBC_01465 TaxID=2903878 RepID=UPI003FCD110B
MTTYAAATVEPHRRWWRQPPRREPKVKRPCSSVARTVEATVMTALATIHGITSARPATAALEATPTPPPQSTKRAKEANGPGPEGS